MRLILVVFALCLLKVAVGKHACYQLGVTTGTCPLTSGPELRPVNGMNGTVGNHGPRGPAGEPVS